MKPSFPTVLDSTIISAARSCLQKANLEFFEHWKPREPSVHLHAGAAYAAGMEAARTAFYLQGHSEADSVAAGVQALLVHYGDFECPPDSAKSLERTAGALEFYFSRYRLGEDKAIPMTLPGGKRGIEFSFVEPLDINHPETGDPLLYSGRMDMLCDYENMRLGEDDKTASQLGASWPRQWDLRSQFTGYCVHPSTEVLTEVGWRAIAALREGTKIATWKDGEIRFDLPSQLIEIDFAGNLTEFNGKVHLLATPEHRQVVFDQYSQTYKTFTINKLPRNSGALRFVSAGIKRGGVDLDKNFIRLLVAFQADGYWKGTAAQFHFRKARKVERLRSILTELEIEFKEREEADGTVRVYTYMTSEVYMLMLSFLGKKKEFDNWLLSLSQACLSAFVEELRYLDGSDYGTKKAPLYFTINPINADWVRTAAALCGRHTSMHVQHDTRSNSTQYRVVLNYDCKHSVHLTPTEQIPYVGKVYCVTVQDSYFLIRSGGRTLITGNCWGAARAGIKLDGFLVRGVSILKTKYDTLEAITYRQEWQLDRWYGQLMRDIRRMIAAWEEGYFDFNLDHACTEYGGCPFKGVCQMREPGQLLRMQFQRRKWNPVTRMETLVEET